MKNKIINIINEEIQNINEYYDDLGIIKLYHKISPKYSKGWSDVIKSVLTNGLLPRKGEEFGETGVIWFSSDYNDYSKNGDFVVALNFDSSTNGYSNNKYELMYEGKNAYALAQIPFNDLEIIKIPILINENRNYIANNKTMIDYINKGKLFMPEDFNDNNNNGKLFADLFNKYVQPYIKVDNFIKQLDPSKTEIVNIF